MLPSEPQPAETARRHRVMILSDGSGITGERVIHAALTQFDPGAVEVDRRSEMGDPARISDAIQEAARQHATVLFSLVAMEHRTHLLAEARRCGVWTIDLLGPLLLRLAEVLEAAPRAEAGLFHPIDEEYFRRIDAIDYTVKHDDGKRVSEIGNADLVLVGVSRSSKTPLSIYLAYRGWHVANVPIVLDLEPPNELFTLPRERVIGLVARPDWLGGVRRERSRRMAPGVVMSYADTAHIEDELRWFQRIAARGGWTVIDVTHKAIEETAAEVIALLPR